MRKEVCEKEAVKVLKYVDVPVCVSVPHYTCRQVVREVPSTECQDHNYQKCHKVPTQVQLSSPLTSLCTLFFSSSWTSLWRPAARFLTRSVKTSTSRCPALPAGTTTTEPLTIH